MVGPQPRLPAVPDSAKNNMLLQEMASATQRLLSQLSEVRLPVNKVDSNSADAKSPDERMAMLKSPSQAMAVLDTQGEEEEEASAEGVNVTVPEQPNQAMATVPDSEEEDVEDHGEPQNWQDVQAMEASYSGEEADEHSQTSIHGSQQAMSPCSTMEEAEEENSELLDEAMEDAPEGNATCDTPSTKPFDLIGVRVLYNTSAAVFCAACCFLAV